MKLSTVLSQARNGELRSSAYTKPENTSKIIDFINLGLLAIHAKFQLKTEEAIIALHSGKTLYKFDGTDNDVTVKGAQLERDKVVNIINVWDSVGEIEINDETAEYTVFTPNYNQLQVTSPNTGDYLSVIFKEYPDIIEYTEGVTDVSTINVDLPLFLLEALLHYVGYRANGAIGIAEEGTYDVHYVRFERACAEIVRLGLVPKDSVNMSNQRKGFML